jgi:hypothetical protein
MSLYFVLWYFLLNAFTRFLAIVMSFVHQGTVLCLFVFMKDLPILKDLLHAVVKASLNLWTMSSMSTVIAIREGM